MPRVLGGAFLYGRGTPVTQLQPHINLVNSYNPPQTPTRAPRGMAGQRSGGLCLFNARAEHSPRRIQWYLTYKKKQPPRTLP